MAELTDDEVKVLKELAANLQAGSRMAQFIRRTILWLASVIGASYIVWDFILKAKH